MQKTIKKVKRSYGTNHHNQKHVAFVMPICRETSLICCNNGKISLPNLPICPELMELICGLTLRGKHFWHYIRFYNNMFAFTSMGVHVNDNVAVAEPGI